MKQFYVQKQTTPTQAKRPFAATPVGVAVNTVRGIPKAFKETGRDVLQGAARSVGSVGVGLTEPFTRQDELSGDSIKTPLFRKTFKMVFGDESIKSLSRRVAENELKIKSSPFAKKQGLAKHALPLAFSGVVGEAALNFTGMGGEKAVVKQLVKETDTKIIAGLLTKLGVKNEIIPRVVNDFAAAKTADEVSDVLRNTKAFQGVGLSVEAGAKEAVEKPLKYSREGVPMALNAREKSIVARGIKETPAVSAPMSSEAKSLQEIAQESLSRTNLGDNAAGASLEKIIAKTPTPVEKKVGIFDYIRTPDRVLKKLGLEAESKMLRTQYDGYLKELPKNIDKITEWSKAVPKASNKKIFQWLDGQDVRLDEKELKVGNEIKSWLGEWADRLGLPKDERIGHYITHIFDDQLIQKEFDEDLARIITDKLPSSVYDPFLQERLGKKGYIEDTWRALDAYVKRATRKVYMDPALSQLADRAGGLEDSQWKYVKRYMDHVNMRPTELDNLLDTGMKQIVGYRLGQRPTARVTKFLRQMTYRAMLGGNISSALKNLSQGANTYAKLGEKYTAIGYAKLLSPANHKELIEQGVLGQGFIEDRVLSAGKKFLQKADKALFAFFEGAERINRGAAYLGAKSKGLAKGMSEEEAIEYAKKIVRDTQFTFGSIDTPVALQGDIAKSLGQFQSYTTKQVEFLSEMVKNKEYAGLIRYAVAGVIFVNTIGEAFGMEKKDLIPIWRIGIPASLKMPVEVVKALADAPNKYGKDRDAKTKVMDVAKSAIGLIPGGVQAKKTIQGIGAVRKGGSYDKAGRKQFKVGGTPWKDTQAVLFGKYVTDEAKEYFNPPKKGKKKLKTFKLK